MTDKHTLSLRSLAASIAARYSALPAVEAVALAGSQTNGHADASSDLDLYVYIHDDLPLSQRAAIATTHADHAEVNNQFWEPGDEWIDKDLHVGVDVMFRHVPWIEEQLDRVLQRHEASVGYSTCIWHNIRASRVLYDRNRWFHHLQARANQPYPEPLHHAIIAKKHPLLRTSISSYLHQIERAVQRDDRISINHRVAALLASYFDVLFALNRLPHPGEKRQLAFAETQCPIVPLHLRDQIHDLLAATAYADHHLIDHINKLIDGLDEVLLAQGVITADDVCAA